MNAQILSASRKQLVLLTEAGVTCLATASSEALGGVVGDFVVCEERSGHLLVTSLLPATRCIYRSYNGAPRRVGANIDKILLVTAVGDVFNNKAISRVVVAARVSQIPLTIVVNKCDLGREGIEESLEVYRKLGEDLCFVSAKTGMNFEEFEGRVDDPSLQCIAFAGVSGVGKSTLVQRLLSNQTIRTAEVSKRTGQGRQTTSQPRGYVRDLDRRKILIDFPGVQFFGLSHLEPRDVLAGFLEVASFSTRCKFRDCSHTKEQDCAVLRAVEIGEIASWRLESYNEILAEIEEASEY